ncbi:hypothetical protein SAMN05444166_5611 [Singulisphaera sp. GP187]|nr:hypothetical protein SAMN05444166_5611 [Singulisphaera sp. GP187]
MIGGGAEPFETVSADDDVTRCNGVEVLRNHSQT